MDLSRAGDRAGWQAGFLGSGDASRHKEARHPLRQRASEIPDLRPTLLGRLGVGTRKRAATLAGGGRANWQFPGALLRRELPGHEPRSVRLTPPPGVVDRVAEPLLRFEQRRGPYWVRIGSAMPRWAVHPSAIGPHPGTRSRVSRRRHLPCDHVSSPPTLSGILSGWGWSMPV